MTFVEACRAWKAVAGSLPVRVSTLFEGEEESGSASLKPFLEENAEELAADLALVCDTGMWSRKRPAIFIALRGLAKQEIVLTAANRDLHSGIFGSAARNPIHILVGILAALHDASGRVTLPGFYEGVAEVSAEIKAQWEGLGFDGAEFLKTIGLSIPAGEVDRSVFDPLIQRIPTLRRGSSLPSENPNAPRPTGLSGNLAVLSQPVTPRVWSILKRSMKTNN